MNQTLERFKSQILEWYGAESEITEKFNALCDNEDTPLRIRIALARLLCREILPKPNKKPQ